MTEPTFLSILGPLEKLSFGAPPRPWGYLPISPMPGYQLAISAVNSIAPLAALVEGLEALRDAMSHQDGMGFQIKTPTLHRPCGKSCVRCALTALLGTVEQAGGTEGQ